MARRRRRRRGGEASAENALAVHDSFPVIFPAERGDRNRVVTLGVLCCGRPVAVENSSFTGEPGPTSEEWRGGQTSLISLQEERNEEGVGGGMPDL